MKRRLNAALKKLKQQKMPVIETKDLCKFFTETSEEVKAVNMVNIQIEQGEFTAIVGPSGSGKTTLLNLIGGLDEPTSGKVVIANTDIYTLKDKDLTKFRLDNIGFVFQAYNLIPVLTAYENTEFTMLLQNRPEAERKQRVTDLLTKVGLGSKLKNKPAELSGGQQQRVAVARALAPKPKFVLADEPTANLDSKSTNDLLDIMATLNEEEGITFVFSTHDQRVIDRAKRIIRIDDGKIVDDGLKK